MGFYTNYPNSFSSPLYVNEKWRPFCFNGGETEKLQLPLFLLVQLLSVPVPLVGNYLEHRGP